MAQFHIVVGDEEFLIERATSHAVTACRDYLHQQGFFDDQWGENASRLDTTKVEAASLTSAQISEIFSPSLFSEARIIVVLASASLPGDVLPALATALGSCPPEMAVVVQHSGGAKGKKILAEMAKVAAVEHSASPITRHNDIVAFIKQEFQRFECSVTSDVPQALITAVGQDLRSLASACSQLVADTGGTVDTQAVSRYHSGVVGVSGFTIADLAVSGKQADAVSALHWALHTGVADVVIADALGDAILSMVLVGSQSRVQGSELAKQGLPPWKVRKIKTQLAKWDPGKLATALRATADLNAQVKGAAVDTQWALLRAVLTVSALARS